MQNQDQIPPLNSRYRSTPLESSGSRYSNAAFQEVVGPSVVQPAEPARDLPSSRIETMSGLFGDDSTLENKGGPSVVVDPDSKPAESFDIPDFPNKRISKVPLIMTGVAVILTILVAGIGLYFAKKSVSQTDVTQKYAVQAINSVDTALASKDAVPLPIGSKVLVNGEGVFTGTISAPSFKGSGADLTNLSANNCPGCVELQQATTLSPQNGNIDISGNALVSGLGVGKTSPSYAVDVVGDINASSSIKVGGKTVCTVAGCGNGGTSVSSLNGLFGSLSIQGTTSQVTLATSGSVITLSTAQNIATTSSPTFSSLNLANNLTLGNSGIITSNFLNSTTGHDLAISSGASQIQLTSGSSVFTLPGGGGPNQIICTDQGNCGGGGATPVLLSPFTPQAATGTNPTIYINDTGSGNLVQLQSGGIDKFVVDNSGNARVSGSLVLGTALGVSSGGTGAASFTQNGVLIGNGGGALSSVAGTNGQCLVANSSSAPSFQTCPGSGGVSSVDGISGPVTFAGTGNQITVNDNSPTAGTITLMLPQSIGTTSSVTFGSLSLNSALSVSNGGTGTNSFTQNGVLIGNGANAPTTSVAGSSNQCLISNVGGAPTFQSCPGGTSSTLQTIYDASNPATILLNSTNGGLTLKDNNPAIGGNLFSVKNNAGTSSYLAVSTSGISVTGTATLTSSLSVSSGGASITGNSNIAGNLTFGATNNIYANNLIQTANGQNIAINAGNNAINFTANGINFILPSTGVSNQTICTTGITCVAGGGQAVILQPNAAQQDNGSSASIFINQTGSGDPLALQVGGSDVFRVTNAGVVKTNTITPTGALTLGSTNQTFTLQGSASSAITATGNSHLTTVNFQGVATADITYYFDRTVATPGSYYICTSTNNCAGLGGGVSSTGGTSGKIAEFNGSQTITNSILTDSSGTITVAGNETVQGSGGNAGLNLGTASTNNGQLVFNNSSNNNTLTLKSGVTGASNPVFTLPVADGSSGQCLSTNGGGVLSFASCLSGGGGGNGVVSIAGSSGVVTLTSTNNQITFTGGGTNVNLALPQDISSSSAVAFSSASLSKTGGNALSLTGTPTNSATTSLFQLGNAISGGNIAVNGGTYIGLNAPGSGAGSTADLLNLQVNGSSQLKVTSTGVATIAGGLTVSSGGANITGGLTSTGTITFSGLSTAGIVTNTSAGVLGTETTVPVSQGGTGDSTLAASGVLYGNGTSQIQATAAGLNGQCLVVSGGVPTFASCGAAVSFQSVYNSSTTQPQIVLNNSPGAGGLIIRDNSTPVGGTLFALQNNSGGTTYLGINSSTVNIADATSIVGATSVTGTLSATSTITFSGLTTAGLVTNTSGGVLGTETSVPVTQGGTGNTSLTSNGVLYGNGSSQVQVTSAGTNGQCLVSVSGVPTFASCGAGVNLQTAYNNSTQPQITLNNSPGAGGLIVKDNSTPVGGTLFGVQNNGGTTKYLDITATTLSVNDATNITGNTAITGNLSATGSVTFSGLTTNGPAYVSGGVLGSETSIPVSQGGTGQTSLTVNGVLYGNGSSQVQVTAAGTNGQCLVSSGGTPIFATCAGTGSGVTLQNAYNNSTGGTTPEILLNATEGGAVDIQDANTTLGATANLFAIRGSATSTTLGSQLFNIQGNGNVGVGVSGNPSALFAVGGSTGNLTVNSSGNIVTGGTYNTNTFTGTGLTFGGGAATIQATAGNNLSLAAGSGSTSLNLGTTNSTIAIGNNATNGVSIQSGQVNSAISVQILTSTDSSFSNTSGGITLATGNETSGGASGGSTGSISITTGSQSNAGNSSTGSITIDTGAQNGSPGSGNGSINIGTSTSGVVAGKRINIGNNNGTTRVNIGTNGTPTGQLYVSGTIPTGLTGSVSTGTTGPIRTYTQGRYTYVANVNGLLQIFDVSNPSSPSSVGSVSAGTNLTSLYVQGRYAYATNESSNTLQIFDVSNPSSPSSVGSASTGSTPYDVYVQGRYAYVVNNGGNTLQIFDVSDPASPSLISTLGVSQPNSVYVQGHYAYIGAIFHLYIVDISNASSPSLSSTTAVGGSIGSLSVQGNYVYLPIFNPSEVLVYNISNPSSLPSPVTISTSIAAQDVSIQGRYLYVGEWSSSGAIQVFDISNLSSVTSVGSISSVADPYFIYVQGRYAYVAAYGANALQIYDLGGTYSQQLQAGGIDVGTLQSSGNVTVNGDQAIQGGLSIGQSLQVNGNIGASGPVLLQNQNNSSAAFQVNNSTGSQLFNINTSTNSVNIDNSGLAGTIQIGNTTGVVTQTINIGTNNTSGATNNINIGNGSFGSGSVVISSGASSGTVSVNSNVGVNIANFNTNTTVTIGPSLNQLILSDQSISGVPGTGHGIDLSTNGETIAVGNTTAAVSESIFIGANNTASSSSSVTIGSTIGASPVVLQAGTGNLKIQNTAGSAILTADTTNSRINIGIAGMGTPTGQLYVAGNFPTSALSTTSAGNSKNPNAIAVKGRYAYVATGNALATNYLQIFDVTIPSSPTLLSTTTLSSTYATQKIVIQGSYAYLVGVTNSSGSLEIYDISNASSPTQVYFNNSSFSDIHDIYISGKYAFLSIYTSGIFKILDISNPKAPIVISSTSGSPGGSIYVQGRYLYFAGDDGSGNGRLRIFDISNPAAPTQVGTDTLGGIMQSIYVQGRYAYVASQDNTFRVYDISNPSSILLVTTLTSGTFPESVNVQGRYAYFTNYSSNNLQLVDISSPNSLQSLGTISTGSGPSSLVVQGRYGYVVNYTSKTLQVFDLGGAYTQQLEAGGIETGSLQVNSSASINGDEAIQGGLTIAQSLQVSGSIGSSGSLLLQNQVNSTSALQIQNSSAANLLAADTTNMRIGINSNYASMSIPTGLSVGTATSGGSLAASTTYFYKVTAIDSAGGETSPSTEASGTTTSSNLTLPVSWTAVTGASGYKVYRSTISGNEAYLTSLLTNSYTDNGSITVGAATPPGTNTAVKSTNNSNSSLQLSIGGSGTPTGQVYVGGVVPATYIGSAPAAANGYNVVTQGRYAYVANNNLQIFDVSNPTAPVLISSTSGVGGAYDIKIQGKYAYINGFSKDVTVVDISNPFAPNVLGSVGAGSGRGIYVQGRYAYVAVYGSTAPFLVYDVSNPAKPVNIGNITTGSLVYGWTIYVQGRYAYMSTNGYGLYIIDISNPSSPSVVSIQSGAGGTSIYVQGRYAYSLNGTQLIVSDISNPASPSIVSNIGVTYTSSFAPAGIIIQGRYAYIASYLNTSGISVYDISNPYKPFYVGLASTNSNVAGFYVQGRYAYLLDASSLKIYDFGGTYDQQLEAGGIETGTLATKGNANITGDLSTQGSLSVGQGIQITGDIGASGSVLLQNQTNSSTAFQIQDSTGAQALVVSTNNVAGGANAANAIIKVAKDSGTGRSINAAGTINASGADYAEYFTQETPGSLQLGQLACLLADGKVADCDSNNTNLIGAVSTNPGYVGNDIYDSAHPNNTALIGLIGQVPVQASVSNGAIAVGDYLTMSSTQPGVAVKATNPGKVIGTAIQPLPSGNGSIQVLVSPSYYYPSPNLQSTNGNFTDLTATGNTTLNNLNVSGASTLASLTVSGDTKLITLTVKDIVVSSSITINGHIVSAGNTPTISVGTGACSGATANISGTDTAGTITVVTGPGCQTSGAIAAINFAKPYQGSPKVVVSPNNKDSSLVNSYVDSINPTGFSLEVGDNVSSSTTYQFSYITVQ